MENINIKETAQVIVEILESFGCSKKNLKCIKRCTLKLLVTH